jgi:hypothetical protein
MNLSLVALCWIAISTLLGVLFGYSSYGLTTATSTAALLIGFVIAVIPLYLHRTKPLLATSEKHRYFGFALCIFFLVFAVREFGQVIFVVNDQVKVISPNNLGDICLHLTHINYLATSPHFCFRQTALSDRSESVQFRTKTDRHRTEARNHPGRAARISDHAPGALPVQWLVWSCRVPVQRGSGRVSLFPVTSA